MQASKIVVLGIGVIIYSVFPNVFATDNKSTFINLDLCEEPAKSQIFKTQIFTPQELIDPIYQLAKDVTDVLEKNEIDYWITFGTLMGAVRNAKLSFDSEVILQPGGLFKWDDDLDYGIMKENIPKLEALKTEFSNLGYDFFPDELVGYKIYSKQYVSIRNESGENKNVKPFLDFFVFEAEDDRYILSSEKGREFFKNGWFHKHQVDTKARYRFGPINVWGPSNPNEYFIRKYGSEWQTKALFYWVHYREIPQKYLWKLTEETLQPALPSKPLLDRVERNYSSQTSRDNTGQFDVNHIKNNLLYWEKIYSQIGLIPEKPSSFCLFLISNLFLDIPAKLLDIGCGNGRDTLELAKYMSHTVGIDASSEVIKKNHERAQHFDGNSISFQSVLINSLDVLVPYKDFDYIYARFFMHAIDEPTENIVMNFFSTLKPGTKLFLEYRTLKDPLLIESKKISNSEGIHTHYRRFIDHENFIRSLEKISYKIDYQIESQNLSVHEKDNPFLARIVAHKEG